MTLTIYDVEQRTPEWDDLRRGMVTASAVGGLLTPTLRVADNDTSRAITATIVAERITGWTEPSHMSWDMIRGVEHESYALDAYRECTGSDVQACGFIVREEDGWSLGYSPDAIVGDDGLVEAKCPRAKTHLQTILADKVPSHYMAQLQAGLLVSGREWIDYVSFVGGMPLYIKRVEPDLDWHAAITAACIQVEVNAKTLTATYRQAVAGLPNTDRVPDLDDIRI